MHEKLYLMGTHGSLVNSTVDKFERFLSTFLQVNFQRLRGCLKQWLQTQFDNSSAAVNILN